MSCGDHASDDLGRSDLNLVRNLTNRPISESGGEISAGGAAALLLQDEPTAGLDATREVAVLPRCAV